MAGQGPSSAKNESELMTTLQGFRYDPLGFARYAFPWGEGNTPLAKYEGPRRWQMEEFKRIQDHLLLDVEKQRIGLNASPYNLAISSGRGPGKSAFLAMLSLWLASCWIGATGIVTANTENQLRSRTMAELGKWHTMLINSHWFDKSAMSLRPKRWFAEMLEQQLRMDTQYYYVEGQSWSKENPDAFAGVHSTIGMMMAMDEASGIDDQIWPVVEGFFTDLCDIRLWIAISNPRKNTGKFYDCFHADIEFWNTRYIDSREVEGVDVNVYKQIVSKYGEESDVARVEVMGLFPRTGANQFISPDAVQRAQDRDLEPDDWEPLVMGVDVARFGDDKSVIRFRRGRDARSIPPAEFKGLSLMDLAQEVGFLINKYKPDAVMIDGGGVGGGVVDRLKQMRYRVIEVQGAERPLQPERYLNKRVEMWDLMKEWLETGTIDDDISLASDLITPEYDKHPTTGKLILESKDKIKARGKPSPDHGDALALTFARPVARMHNRIGTMSQQRIARDVDYAIFGA